MDATKVNLNGIQELDLVLEGTTTAAITAPGIVTVTNTGGGSSNVHDEPLTDGNANFIFAATLTTGGDIIVVVGIPN